MTQHKSEEMVYRHKLSAAFADGRVKIFKATVNLAGQAKDDTILLTEVPKGYVFSHGVMTAGASLETATLAVGTADNPTKYKAAAVFTDVDKPLLFGKASANAELAADEKIIASIGVAALPAEGVLKIDMFFSAI